MPIVEPDDAVLLIDVFRGSHFQSTNDGVLKVIRSGSFRFVKNQRIFRLWWLARISV